MPVSSQWRIRDVSNASGMAMSGAIQSDELMYCRKKLSRLKDISLSP